MFFEKNKKMRGLRYLAKRSASLCIAVYWCRVQGIARFADALGFRSGTLTPSLLHTSPLGRTSRPARLRVRAVSLAEVRRTYLSDVHASISDAALLTLHTYYTRD